MAEWRRDEPRVPRPCATCGRETSSQPSNPDPRCVDCFRARAGLDDELWFKPIGSWHPTIGVVPNPQGVPEVYARPEKPAWPARDPIPEVLSTDDWPAGLATPRAVLLLQQAGMRGGWLVRVGFSRSPERAVKVGTYKMTEAFALWSAPHPDTGWRFNAIHTHTVGSTSPYTWRSTAIWKVGTPRFSHALVTDLREFFQVRGSVPLAWFKGIEARELDKLARQKVAATNRPKAKKEGSS